MYCMVIIVCNMQYVLQCTVWDGLVSLIIFCLYYGRGLSWSAGFMPVIVNLLHNFQKQIFEDF